MWIRLCVERARALPAGFWHRSLNGSSARAWPAVAEVYARGQPVCSSPDKDPRGWREFAAQLAEHSAIGSALTLLGVQGRRPSVYALEAQMRQLRVPTLIVTGDEDEPCLEPGLFMKRAIPTRRAGGHAQVRPHHQY